VKDGKPLNAIRREQKYTTGDEWRNVYRRTSTGELQQLSEKELAETNSSTLRGYYHRLPNGIIGQVFEASAQFCEKLASRAFKLEAELTNLASSHGQTAFQTTNSAVDFGAAPAPEVPKGIGEAPRARLSEESEISASSTQSNFAGLDGTTSEVRPTAKQLVLAAMASKKIRSYEKFAAGILIGRDALYAMTMEKRWVSDQVYGLVAKACECKPEELHPRDIPLPDRRRL
jgi:hypothetical protein